MHPTFSVVKGGDKHSPSPLQKQLDRNFLSPTRYLFKTFQDNPLNLIVFIYCSFGIVISLYRLVMHDDPQHDIIRSLNVLFYLFLVINIFKPDFFEDKALYVIIFLMILIILNMYWLIESNNFLKR